MTPLAENGPHRLAGRWLLLAALLYAGLFGWYTWPLLPRLGSAMIGSPASDTSQYIWNAWNFRRQVAAGHNPMATPLLLYPAGSGLWMHTYTPVLGLLDVLVQQDFVAVNLGLLLSFVLSGVGAARLAGRWVRQPLLCGLVGLAFAFSPYKMTQLSEHYHLVLTATVPFYVDAFLTALAFAPGRWRPRVRSGRVLAGAAVLLALTLLSDYYALAGLLLFSASYAAWWGLRLGSISWRRWQPWAVLAAVLVAGHFVSRGLALLGLDDKGGLWWGGDLATYLVPPVDSRWLGTAASLRFWHSPRLHAPGSVENNGFLGYVLPLLALTLVLWRQPGPTTTAAPAETRPFWALLLLFVALTMPELRWQGHDLFRLPTGVLHYVPFLNNIRCPVRYVLLATLLLPLAVSVALDARLRLAPGWLRWGLPLALLLLVGSEYRRLDYPLYGPADVPLAYRQAAALPGPVLFSVPLGLQDGVRELGRFGPGQEFYQVFHGKALRGAYLSRLPARAFADFRQEPALRRLLLAQAQATDSLAQLPPLTPAELAAFRQRYPQAVFVIHPEQRTRAAHQLLRQWLLLAGYRDDDVEDGGQTWSIMRPR